MSHFQSFMESIFQLFAERGIVYLVLRNYEDLPEKTTNDVDILVDPSSLKSTKQAVLDSAIATGWILSNVGHFSCLSLFFFRPDSLEQTHIDLMHGNLWHSLVFADHRRMLADRIPLKRFFVPSPADEAWVNFSTRLLYGGYVKEKYRPFIRSFCSEHPDTARTVFTRFLGRALASECVALCASNRWNDVEQLTRKTRWRVILENFRNPFSLLARLSHDALRIANRINHPPGLVVGLVCTDVEWREKVADMLMNNLQGTFYPEKTFRWKEFPYAKSVWYSARKNAFHGGLSILDLPIENDIESRCDLVFSDNKYSGSSVYIPSKSTEVRSFVMTTVLQFLHSRLLMEVS